VHGWHRADRKSHRHNGSQVPGTRTAAAAATTTDAAASASASASTDANTLELSSEGARNMSLCVTYRNNFSSTRTRILTYIARCVTAGSGGQPSVLGPRVHLPILLRYDQISGG
jgi:hypothetical protein